MRLLSGVLVIVGVLAAACQPSPNQPQGLRVQAARLVLATYAERTLQLHAVDPTTLEDTPDLSPIELPGCAGPTVTQPGGKLLAVADCNGSNGSLVRLLDLTTWQWRSDLSLTQAGEEQPWRAARLFGSAALAWSPDGSSLYAVGTQPGAPRKLWRFDVAGGSAPVSIALDTVPVRLDIAPNGTGVYVLGGLQREDRSMIGGTTLLTVYDPSTLAVRTRIPLPGAKVVVPSRATPPLLPAVALAPDGSRYYIAHADEPVLEVVDMRAPKLERWERNVSLRSTPTAQPSTSVWLAVSPDGAHLRTWRSAPDWDDDTGLQVIDTHTWQATTVDSIAMRLWGTLDGGWWVRLDPPTARFARDWRNVDGLRMSAIDARTNQPAATLLDDARPLNIGQFGDERLYVQAGRPSTVRAYEVGTWQELATRDNAWLVTSTALW